MLVTDELTRDTLCNVLIDVNKHAMMLDQSDVKSNILSNLRIMRDLIMSDTSYISYPHVSIDDIDHIFGGGRDDKSIRGDGSVSR